MLDTVVFVDSSVKEYFTNEMVLVKVNAEKDTLLARRFHVSGYPTAVLVTNTGEEVDRIVGYAPPDEYLKTIKDYRNGIGTLDDLLTQAGAGPDRELFYKVADKYKYRGGDSAAIAWYTKVVEAGEPTDSLSGEARMALADMHRRAKEYDKSLATFAAIKNDFGTGRFAEAAGIWTAIVYRAMGDTTAAINAFEAFISSYPESEDVGYAKAQVEKLKNPPPPKTDGSK
ncbi:MAG: tetratricopeptide repeat protein [candidate division Zixibacteria bacterium]|jgi:tetratricopeptide (TPR) repeat protein|nr:tetratricopeptide repeat protein [candidate division Zixibacteria bacterium]